MGKLNVYSDIKSTIIGIALENVIRNIQERINEKKQQIDDIVDYTSIAQDIHSAVEKVDQYILRYHSKYIENDVLTQEEKKSFLDGIFNEYPDLRMNKSLVSTYLLNYLERINHLIQKEMTLSERVLLNHEIDNNRLLQQILNMVSEIIDEQRNSHPLKPYNDNLMYAQSFCETLFLHRNNPDSRVNMQNLFVLPEHLVESAYNNLVEPDYSLNQEIEHFVSGKKTALFIVGDAGTGKSTLVSWINYHYCLGDEISKTIFKDRPVITVRLRDLDRDYIGHNRLMNAILAYLNIDTLDDLTLCYPAAIMILDGFDELCMIEGLIDYEYLLNDVFRKNLPHFQFIITTRPKYLDIHKVCVDYTYIHLKHFSRALRNQWLDKYMYDCKAEVSDFIEDYIRSLSDEDDYDGMNNSDDTAVCDTPMTLYMIVSKRITQEALVNHWALYQQIFYQELSDTEYNKMFPNKEWRYEHPIHRYKDLLYRISEEISYEMYRTGNRTLHLSNVQLKRIISDILECSVTDDEISEIAERCYALCTYWKADTRKGFVEFYHNNIRDFFLCERIYRRMNGLYVDIDNAILKNGIKTAFRNDRRDAFDYSIVLGKDLSENYSSASFETKVCQFIYERSFYENTVFSQFHRISFSSMENQMHLFPLTFQNMLSFKIPYNIIPNENYIQYLCNILTCAAQIFRYAAEPFLINDNSTQEKDEILFQWWDAATDVNEIGTLKYLFRAIFRQVPVTYDDGIMISMASKSDFSGVDLNDCDLREIDFRYSNLTNANFTNAVLDRCDFRNTKREFTDFTNSTNNDVVW